LSNQWFILNQYLRQPTEASEVAKTLIDLQPGLPWTHHCLAWSSVALRRFDEAEAGMRTVLEIDPSYAYALGNLAHLLYRRGAFEEAVELYRGIHERSHQSEQIASDVHDSLCFGLALQGAGREDEARTVLEAEIEALRAQSASAPLVGSDRGRQAALLATAGKAGQASALAREIEAEDSDDPYLLFSLAETYALIGEPDHAVALLERANRAGYDDPYFILVDPLLRDLQNRPELEQLAPPS
jgi:tetratricopeptide (TPR) repeat protein